MIELRQWFQDFPRQNKDWLLVGKGPTFAQRNDVDFKRYNTVGLNEVVNEVRVDVAHIIDIEVVANCAKCLLENCQTLLMPRHPHVSFRATERKLEDFFNEYPVLAQLDQARRLVWYNLQTGQLVGDSPSIDGRFFSSGAVVDILGTLGITRIRTLGVDGGRQKSAEFSGNSSKYALPNGRENYNLQFSDIERSCEKHGIDFQPLIDPLRIFCGADESQRIPSRVLEYSITSNTNAPVCFEPLHNLELPVPVHQQNRARTGFSFYRFAIPKLCNYRGSALYLDSDMLVFDDISQLWNLPFEESDIKCTYQTRFPDAWKDKRQFKPGRQLSVMMLDCERLGWDVAQIIKGLDEGDYEYSQLMFELCIVDADKIGETIPPEWNCLEWYEPQRTKLLHYTVVPTQPWKSSENPNGKLWEKAFYSAHEDGAISDEEIIAAVSNGYLRNSFAKALNVDVRADQLADLKYREWGKPIEIKKRPGLFQRLGNSVRKRIGRR